MKNHDRTEISINILKAAVGVGTTKTQLMYQSFISFEQLRKHLSELMRNGLIESDPQNVVYKTTRKGIDYLLMHNNGMDELTRRRLVEA